VVFSPDGKLIATASQDGNQLWDVATGQEVFQFGSKLMTSVMFSPDGKYILSGNVVDKTAQLWDAVTGREVRQFIGDTDGVWTAVFSPDGKYIATASADGTARLWDPQTGQELRRFIGHAAGIEDVIFSPDGKYILTGSDDGTARLWDVDYHTTMQYLCSILWRDFTDEERQEYDIKDTTATCPTS
jgi:WD40 repeat protein